MTRPEANEHSEFHARYVNMVPESDLLSAMQAQTGVMRSAFLAYTDTPDHTYAPGKWTVRQMLGHMTDTERLFGSRLLFAARADPAALPGIEQDGWMAASDFTPYTLPELLSEFETVRAGHRSLLSHLPPEVWDRRITASGSSFTVRALAYMLLGHERAHLEVLQQRYASGAEVGSGKGQGTKIHLEFLAFPTSDRHPNSGPRSVSKPLGCTPAKW